MGVTLDIQVTGPNATRLLESISRTLRADMPRRLLLAAQHASGEIRQTIYETYSGSSGKLARSWRERFLGIVDGALSAEAYSNLVYARIQNEGGTIRPRVRQYLAVPLHRFGRIPVGKWPRHWAPGKLRFIPRAGQGGLLVEMRGKGKRAKMIPRYSLRRQVEIPPERYLERGAALAGPGVETILRTGIALAVEGVTP